MRRRRHRFSDPSNKSLPVAAAGEVRFSDPPTNSLPRRRRRRSRFLTPPLTPPAAAAAEVQILDPPGNSLQAAPQAKKNSALVSLLCEIFRIEVILKQKNVSPVESQAKTPNSSLNSLYRYNELIAKFGWQVASSTNSTRKQTDKS